MHGLEDEVKRRYDKDKVKTACVRFADDFVILHQDRQTLEQIKRTVEAWLAEAGLRLNAEKTRVVHTLDETDGQRPGFDFLGFTFRHHRAGRHKAARDNRGRLLPFKTSITPSKEAQQRHLSQLGAILKQSWHLSGLAVINRLNPVIRGWSMYYRHVSSKATFTRIEHCLHYQLRRWGHRKHPRLGKNALTKKYWDGYTFTDGRARLEHHAHTPIVRHAKVRGRKSPFDGDWLYWSLRFRKGYLGKTRVLGVCRTYATCGISKVTEKSR